MMRLQRIERYFGLGAKLYAKLEKYNPSGSVKDRGALYMIEDAYRRGLLREGDVLVEPTSGNMGISLAMLSSVYRYKAVIVMPENMSVERIALIGAYGGEVILTEASRGMSGAIERAEQIIAEFNAYSPSQFTNQMNMIAHYETTGAEIFTQMRGRVDILICGVGTGGTVMGAATFLKEKNPAMRVIAVEPSESAVLSGGNGGSHGIQGIGAGFVPPIINESLIDEVISVSTEQAYEGVRFFASREGILLGISSGAAVMAAIGIAKREENRNKRIVLILPDGGEKYISNLY